MKRFKNILFFNDGSTEPSPALQRAVSLADANNARLTLIDVINEHASSSQIEEQFGSDLNNILREHHRLTLEEMVQPFNESDAIIYTQVLTGIPFIEVIRSVQNNNYDLLIKACRSPEDISERMFGSTDMHLMRKCPCPVWIDRPGETQPYRKILAAVDPVDEESKGCAHLVMDLASSLAQRESAELNVVHTWHVHGESILRYGRGRIPEKDLERHLEHTHAQHQEALDNLLTPYDLNSQDSHVHLLKGRPAVKINSLCRDQEIDLIVMGTVGRTGIPGFFIGNTAEEVLQTTSASVLTVKPADFLTPVA